MIAFVKFGIQTLSEEHLGFEPALSGFGLQTLHVSIIKHLREKEDSKVR
jgi:hypothetical protein